MKIGARFVIGLSVGLAVGYGAAMYTGIHACKTVNVARVEPSDSPDAKNLKELRAQLQELLLTHTESSPVVQNVRRRIEVLEKRQSAK
ncbi:MAG TPA: hypothetical protein P5205_18005 [Candidatus Paceibacterota bacterium]|nr:hypothetical protein [Verrucomicrobiota bacterium]HSA12258.1 hypothetical protein [Candidatus Paceibacterota bacterium]